MDFRSGKSFRGGSVGFCVENNYTFVLIGRRNEALSRKAVMLAMLSRLATVLILGGTSIFCCGRIAWSDEAPAPSSVRRQEIPVEEALRRAVKGWERLRGAFLHCRGTGVLVDEVQRGAEKKSSKEAVAFWVDGTSKRVDLLADGSTERVVLSLNKKYAFKATAVAPENRFVITLVEPFAEAYWTGMSQGLPNQIEAGFHRHFREFVHAGWTLYGLPLDEMSRSNGFTVESARQLSSDGDTKLELSCRWSPPNPDLTSCDNITLLLLPSMDYTIERFVCDYGGSLVSMDISYSLVNGIPVPQVATRTVQGVLKPENAMRARFEMKEFEFGTFSESNFVASAIGAAEPTGDPHQKLRVSRFSIVLFLNLLFVAFIALWFFLRRKRRSRLGNINSPS
jgi:hypothetical protein